MRSRRRKTDWQRMWALGFSLVVAGCHRDDPTPEPTPSASPTDKNAHTIDEPRDVVEPGPGVQADGTVRSAVSWFEGSFEQAKAKAAQTNKSVFLLMGAYWCPPCHRLDEEVFVRPDVAAAIEDRAIPIHIDVERGDGPELVLEYNVMAYPTILMLTADGIEKGRVVDFLPGDELKDALERIDAKKDVLAGLAQDVANDPDDLEARYRWGHALALAADRTRAEEQFQALLVADPQDELGYASKVLYDRAMFFRAKLDRDPQAAIAAFTELQQRYPGSPQASLAYRQIGRMYMRLGDEPKAIHSLEAMLAEDPDDKTLAARFGWFCFRQQCTSPRALEVVNLALEREDDAELRYVGAELAALQKDFAQANTHIERAVALAPNSAFYRRQQQRFRELR